MSKNKKEKPSGVNVTTIANRILEKFFKDKEDAAWKTFLKKLANRKKK